MRHGDSPEIYFASIELVLIILLGGKRIVLAVFTMVSRLLYARDAGISISTCSQTATPAGIYGPDWSLIDEVLTTMLRPELAIGSTAAEEFFSS